MEEIVIQAENLTKSFGATRAVDNVSINVRKGEIYGFLGLNGAGKTTTIRLLLKMIGPDSGSFSLLNKGSRFDSSVWNKIGYMVESPFSYPNLSVVENLRVICKLRGLQWKGAVDEIIDLLHLKEYKDKKAKHLSLGNKQRLGLAKALIHKPELLFLDEPVNGLDPAGIVEIREYLQNLASAKGATLFISSHILSEISHLATRIGIIHEGRIILEVGTDELQRQIKKSLIINSVDNKKAMQILSCQSYQVKQDSTFRIELEDDIALNQPEKIAELLVHNGVPPKEIFIQKENLEDFFLRILSVKSSL